MVNDYQGRQRYIDNIFYFDENGVWFQINANSNARLEATPSSPIMVEYENNNGVPNKNKVNIHSIAGFAVNTKSETHAALSNSSTPIFKQHTFYREDENSKF